MKKNILGIFIYLAISIISLQNTSLCFADNFGLDQSAKTAKLVSNDTANQSGDELIKSLVQKIVGYILSFVGVIFLIQIIIAGLKWMTAGGNTDVTKKSKAQITDSVIALVIIAGAYLLSSFVFQFIGTVTK